jgi:hypothetical protein
MSSQKPTNKPTSFAGKPLTHKEQQKQQTQESNQREIARNNPKIDNNIIRGYN